MSIQVIRTVAFQRLVEEATKKEAEEAAKPQEKEDAGKAGSAVDSAAEEGAKQ